MASKLKTLEHLDGKQVRFSTLTSQYPELFVQRKRNTGDLIISTDTDPKYGMHHIYAGGEHIAAGYGFASIKTRNDLTYVQETYNSTFKYFDDAYTYLSTAYVDLRSYVYDSYEYLKSSIKENSYKNITIGYNNSDIVLDDTTYSLQVENGSVMIVKNINKYIRITSPKNYYLQKNFLTVSNDYSVNNDIDYISGEFLGKPFIYAYTILNIEFDRNVLNPYTIDNKYFMFKYETKSTLGNDIMGNADVTLQGCSAHNFDAGIKTLIKESNSNILIPKIPIIKDDNTEVSLYIFNNQEEFNKAQNGENNYDEFLVDKVTFKWVNPILYKNSFIENNYFVTEDDFTNELFTPLLTEINEDTHIENLQIEISGETDSTVGQNHTVMLIPNKNNEPLFYLNNNIAYRENNEGGMMICNGLTNSYGIDYSYANNKLNKSTYNLLESCYYNLYVSDMYKIPTYIRYDIDFI